MRLIDVSIPKFGDAQEDAATPGKPSNVPHSQSDFQLPRLFSQDQSHEYHVDDDEKSEDGDPTSPGSAQEEFFEADSGVPDVRIRGFPR